MTTDSRWWKDGLRFECTKCGLCCRGQGRVEVSDAEIERLAKRQGLSPEQFREVYTRKGRRGRIDLRDKKNADCIFFKEGQGCTVYEDRPVQCRTYPFWKPVLFDRDSWASEADECEGIGRGERVTAAEIQDKLDRRG